MSHKTVSHEPVNGKSLLSQCTLIASVADYEEVLTRDNLAPSDITVVNVSAVLDLLSCTKKGYLRHVAFLTPARPDFAPPLYTGSQLHAAVDLIASGETDFDALRRDIEEDYANLRAAVKAEGLDEAKSSVLLATMTADEQWLLDALGHLPSTTPLDTVLTSERAFGLYFAGSQVLLIGTPDQFVVFNGGFWHRQVKSISVSKRNYFQRYLHRIRRSLHEALYAAVGFKLVERFDDVLPPYQGTLLDAWCKEARPKSAEELLQARPKNTYDEPSGFGLSHKSLSRYLDAHPRTTEERAREKCKEILAKRRAWLERVKAAPAELETWRNRLFSRDGIRLSREDAEAGLRQLRAAALVFRQLASQPNAPDRAVASHWMNEQSCDAYSGCPFNMHCKRYGREHFIDSGAFVQEARGYVADVKAGHWPEHTPDALSDLTS